MADVILQDIIGNYLDAPDAKEKSGAFDHGVAHFSDGTTLSFPEDVTFVPDPHYENAVLVQYRLLVKPPMDETGKPKSPPFLIPAFCTKKYVEMALERLQRGV